MDTLLKYAVVLLVAVILIATLAGVIALWTPLADLAESGRTAIDAEYTYAGSHVDGSPADVLARVLGLLPDGSPALLAAFAFGSIAILVGLIVARWLIGLVVQS